MFSNLSVLDYILIPICVAGAIYCVKEIIESIKEKDFGLDVLALIAIIATFIQGEFLASFVVVLMTLTGEFLEDFASKKAKNELNKLYDKTPKIAHLLEGESSVDVSLEDVKTGSLIRVFAGEIVPVDGILKTNAILDNSSLTGESLLVNLNAGDKVFSGSVVIDSLIELETSTDSKNSQYQKIVDLVENAQKSKNTTVRLASAISIPFTIVSLLIAFIAWFISGESLRFAEVLVLATPCPLLIAAPVAFIGGVSRAAKLGIIVKTAAVFEKMNKIKVIAFDKTGTLTKGKPEVKRIFCFENNSENEVLEFAASLENVSNHIFAKAITSAAKEKGLNQLVVSSTKELVGKGIYGKIDNQDVKVGNWSFVNSQDKEPEIGLEAGQTPVFVNVDNKTIGAVILQDELRKSAKETILGLKKLGVIHLAMFTGDKRETALKIAGELEIKDVRSELLPEQKLEALLGLKHSCSVHNNHQNSQVAFVGDGVNDAPVLAAADVSIAIANNDSAASSAADVVLLSQDVKSVLSLDLISKQTKTIALESMVLGISLSVVLMVIAAFGYIPAVAGAGLQELIDFVAIVNSVRAAFKK